MASSRPRKGQF